MMKSNQQIKVGDFAWSSADGIRSTRTAMRVCSIQGATATLEWWESCGSMGNPHKGDACTCTPLRCTSVHSVEWLIRCPDKLQGHEMEAAWATGLGLTVP
jgi:hypothetical protein